MPAVYGLIVRGQEWHTAPQTLPHARRHYFSRAFASRHIQHFYIYSIPVQFKQFLCPGTKSATSPPAASAAPSLSRPLSKRIFTPRSSLGLKSERQARQHLNCFLILLSRRLIPFVNNCHNFRCACRRQFISIPFRYFKTSGEKRRDPPRMCVPYP